MLNEKEPFPIRAEGEARLDRRRFLRAAAGAALLTSCGEWAAGALERERPRLSAVSLDPHRPLAIGEARALTDTAGIDVLAVRLDEATVVAFDRRCPHLGCPVLWSAERARFECPCHHAAFDARTGAVLFGPPRRGLTRAPVTTA